MRVPQREGEFAHEPVERTLAPALEARQENGGVAELPDIRRRWTELPGQLLTIIETHIGDQSEPPVPAPQWLPVIRIFRHGAKQPPPDRQRPLAPLRAVVRPVDVLRCQHARAIGGRIRLALEPP